METNYFHNFMKNFIKEAIEDKKEPYDRSIAYSIGQMFYNYKYNKLIFTKLSNADSCVMRATEDMIMEDARTGKEIFFQCIQDKENVTQILKLRKGKSPTLNLSQVLPQLEVQEVKQVWIQLELMAAKSALSVLENQATDHLGTPSKDHMVLRAIVHLCHSFITIVPSIRKHHIIPSGLQNTLVLLYRSLPTLGKNLGAEICSLCELWYNNDMPDKNLLINNAIVFLMKKILSNSGTKSDIKKLLAVKDGLWNANSLEHITNLLPEMAKNSFVLSCNEGIKFLSFAFGNSTDLIEELHDSIKSIIPGASKQLSVSIGQVYFKAWRQNAGELRLKIETYCIQDLMSRAVLANRQLLKKQAIFPSILQILDNFHKVRNDRQCQAMVAKLWEPILWRQLNVANPMVRQNAAEIFFNAFPIENPYISLEEQSRLAEKQFKVMIQLLMDESPEVRISAIHGSCMNILVYWTIIPLEVLNRCFSTLVKDLAFDASSFKVRLAVIKGFQMMLNFERSHMMLKAALPRISDCLHDINESVRLAMVDLLIMVKSIKAIHYWDICPLKDLLARLQVDSSSINRKIVKLIFNSFFPTDQQEDTKIERCIHLIKSNRKASRKFYEFSGPLMNTHDSVKFLLAIVVKLKKDVKEEMQRVESAGLAKDKENQSKKLSRPRNLRKRKLLTMTSSSLDESLPGSESDASSVLTKSSRYENINLSQESKSDEQEVGDDNFSDHTIVAGLLDVACIVWFVKSKDICSKENVEYRSLLENKSAKILTTLFRYYKSTEVIRPVLYLSSLLPHSLVTNMAGFCMSRLRTIEIEEELDAKKIDNLPIYVDALCNWKRGDDLLELITNWLTIPDQEPASPISGKRGVRFAETDETLARPELALVLLQYLLQHNINRTILLNKNRSQMEQLAEVLSKQLVVFKFKLYKEQEWNLMEEKKWVIWWTCLLKTLVILTQRTDETSKSDTMSRLENALEFLQVEVLPCDKLKAKRIAGQLIPETIRHCSNMLTLGICDVNFIGHCTEFVCFTLSKDSNQETFQMASLLVHEMADWIVAYSQLPSMTMVNTIAIPNLYDKILKSLRDSDSDIWQNLEFMKNIKFHLGQVISKRTSEEGLHKCASSLSQRSLTKLRAALSEGTPFVVVKAEMEKFVEFVVELSIRDRYFYRTFLDEMFEYNIRKKQMNIFASSVIISAKVNDFVQNGSQRNMVIDFLDELQKDVWPTLDYDDRQAETGTECIKVLSEIMGEEL